MKSGHFGKFLCGLMTCISQVVSRRCGLISQVVSRTEVRSYKPGGHLVGAVL